MDWRDAENAYDGPEIGETTLGRLFEESAARNRDRPAQRYKGGVYDRSLTDDVIAAATPGRFRALSYGEMRDIVRKLAAGFRDLGIDSGDRIAIFAHTRMEWAQCDFAALAAGAVVTTVYPESSNEQLRYLLSDSGADIVIAENEQLLEAVFAVEADLDLETLVSIDTLETVEREDVLTLADVYRRGEETFEKASYERWLDEPGLDELASLIYTSGTTGQPKGVELTHWNFRSNVNGIRRRFRPRDGDGVPGIDEKTQTVSYLPLAHVFERTAGHFLQFACGACVAYAEAPDTLQEDFGLVQPTAATSVPRVYEKIYDTIREQASESSIKQRIFEWATDVGVAHQQAADPGLLLSAKQTLADRLVFSTVREALGGEIELLISGGGSLSADLCLLYHAMGLPIYEGYGLTETAPVVTVNPPEATNIGTIGPAISNVELRIDEAVATHDAFADDPGVVGELLVSGPNVSPGYWNDPVATDEAFEEDDSGRWFRTGDIVHRRPDGYLEFRERVKQLLVLSTGKNVAPGPIEDAFAASEVVEQAMVVGDDEKFVGALLVPNTDHITAWADREGVDLPDDPEARCDHEQVRAYVASEVEAVNEDLERHETIKRFELIPQEFTEENEMLTPTMKKKRRVIQDVFADRIDRLYEREESLLSPTS